MRKILKVGEFRGYTVKLVSSSAEGLGIGSPVVLSGVQIGKVSKIDLSEDGKNAIITLQIRGGVRITKDAKFQLKMKGVLGDRIISIEQGESQEALKDGDVIILEKSESEISQITADIGQALFEFSETMRSARKLLENLNSIVSDVNQSKSIQRTTEGLNRVVEKSEELINDMRKLISDINETFNKISPKVLESVNQSSADVREITKNAREISERLLKSSEDIQKLLASLEKEGIISLMGQDKEKIKNKREDYDLLSYLKKDIIGNSSIIFSTILGIIGKTIGWRRLFLIPLEILTTFLVATYICVKVSYEFGFDPKEKKEKKFILDLVLRILTSKEIIKEKSKIYLNLNPKPIFILDNLKTNQKIISSIYEEIEKTYRERLEKNMNENGKTNEKTSKNKTI
jgi:phospholipid/cholesterol/gamma-HCH transport system substrate-binding protein